MNLSYAVDAFVLAEKAAAEALTKISNVQLKCLSANKGNLGVAYPGNGFATYSLRSTIPKSEIPKQVIERKDIFYVAGCFSYDTFSITRYSNFCMFYSPKVSKPESWNFCLIGNNAY